MPRSPRLCLALALAVATPAAALAADLIVTRYDDPAPDGCLADDCSLREAVIEANEALGLDRILLSAGTYELSIVNVAGEENAAATGDLDITSNVELLGPGATMTTIDANGIDRALHFLAPAASTELTVRGVTITGGANVAPSAIQLAVGIATIEECDVRANGVTSGVGAIFQAAFGSTTFRRTTIRSNSGVGLSVVQSEATLENVTFSNNGALEIQAVSQGVVHCRHCTLAGSAAETEVSASSTGTVVDFENSIVVGLCSAGSGAAIDSLDGNVESLSTSCGFGLGSDQDGVAAVDLALGALADNGGLTPTHLPGVASVATTGNAVDALCLDVASDQRGVARAADCDSGAVERTSAHVETPIFIDGFLQGNPDAWSDTVP